MRRAKLAMPTTIKVAEEWKHKISVDEEWSRTNNHKKTSIVAFRFASALVRRLYLRLLLAIWNSNNRNAVTKLWAKRDTARREMSCPLHLTDSNSFSSISKLTSS